MFEINESFLKINGVKIIENITETMIVWPKTSSTNRLFIFANSKTTNENSPT